MTDKAMLAAAPEPAPLYELSRTSQELGGYEPAPQEQKEQLASGRGGQPSHCEGKSSSKSPAGAVPLPDDVAAKVERLRDNTLVIQHPERNTIADMLESMARELAYEKKSKSEQSDAARKLAMELAAVKAENEKLREDADRYRWLRDEAWACYNFSKEKPEPVLIVATRDGCGNVKMILAEEALDAAIDAAMKEGK